MITVLDDDGRQAFAFDAETDPWSVVRLVAWAFPRGRKLCTIPGCPSAEGSYCLECHGIGSTALAFCRSHSSGSAS